MFKPHKLSAITPLSELDIFQVPPTQESVLESIVTEHRPIHPLDSGSMLEYEFKTNMDEAVPLQDIKLNIVLEVEIDNASHTITEADVKKCAITNNLMHSLFQDASMTINGKSVTLNPQHYGYKAYFENTLGYTTDAKMGLTKAWGLFDDFDVKTDWEDDDGVTRIVRKDTYDSTLKAIDLMGKLHLDMCLQPKALIGGCTVNIKLNPNKSDFYLWFKAGVTVKKVTFKKASLYVTRFKLNPLIIEAQNIALMRGNAKYPITRGEIKTFNIPTGQTDIMIDHAFDGQLPRRLVLTMVKSDAYNGDLKLNPYEFQHNRLNYLAAHINGIQYPSIPYTPDFDNNIFTREFLSIFETLNIMTTDCYLNFNRGDFKLGCAMFGFNFASDSCDDYLKSGYIDPKKEGTMGFHLKFKSAPTSSMVLVIYAEFDNFVEIDINRQVTTDYH